MRNIYNIMLSFAAGVAMLASCSDEDVVYTITSDRASITEIPAQNPGTESLILETNAPYWIVLTPNWVKPDAITGVGGSSVVTFTILSNYKDENTDVAPREGEIVFSGGGTSLKIPVAQLGYTAPVDPDASIGGITDIDEFKDFIEAVNEGGNLSRWYNDEGEIELLTDLNLAAFDEWVPIGMPETVSNANNASSYTGSAFKGVFNGGGHTISNFNVGTTLAEGTTFGFFGLLDGAVVKNLTIKGKFNVNATGTADAGIVAGTVYCSTIENVTVEADVKSAGSTMTKRFSIGGVAGYVISSGTSNSVISGCSYTGNVDAVCGDNAANGATCVMFGGIAGFSTNPKDDSRVTISDCTADGKMTVKVGRCSGIVASANCGTILRKCTNNADQVNTMVNGRIGNLVSLIGLGSCMEDCVNNGDLMTTDVATTTGGMAALLNDNSVYIKGGANYGTIIGANTKYLGIIAANMSKFGSITGFTVSGKIGEYNAEGNHNMYPMTSSTYMDYLGAVSDANRTKISDLKFEESK